MSDPFEERRKAWEALPAYVPRRMHVVHVAKTGELFEVYDTPGTYVLLDADMFARNYQPRNEWLAMIDADLRAEQARAVAEAVRVQREKDCAAVCSGCRYPDQFKPAIRVGDADWMHPKVALVDYCCHASAIHEAAHAEAEK